MKIQVFPSILASDFGKLSEEAKRLEDAGADAIHVDIMDGHFVPNLTLGPKAVAAINRSTDLFLDVHIMVYNPYDFVERFVEAGADRITFHFEATEDVETVIDYIKKCNVKVGLAFNPETSYEMVTKFIGKTDLILMMTVNPGFGGQKFMPEVLEKVTRLKRDIDQLGEKVDIQVDGGIDEKTGKLAKDAGANIFVAGTSLYKQDDLASAISRLKSV